MKAFLDKLIEFFQSDKKEDPETTLGFHLIDNYENPIEVTVNENLKIEYSDDHLYIDSESYVGIVRIDRIVEIIEI